MEPIERHKYASDVSFDGGDLDCGGGLLLLIRRHIDPLARGGLLEILSTDATVEVELPAWCRLTSNELVSWTKVGRQRSYLVCKGPFEDRGQAIAPVGEQLRVAVTIPESLPGPAPRRGLRRCLLWGLGVGRVLAGCFRRCMTGSRAGWMTRRFRRRRMTRCGFVLARSLARGLMC